MKLTQLYEYYMMSLDEASVRELPTAVLYFFNYNNQLDWPKKAFLYRYIISRKQSLERIYYSYDNIMRLLPMNSSVLETSTAIWRICISII